MPILRVEEILRDLGITCELVHQTRDKNTGDPNEGQDWRVGRANMVSMYEQNCQDDIFSDIKFQKAREEGEC